MRSVPGRYIILVCLLFCGTASAERIRDVEAISADTRLVYGSVDFYNRGKLRRNNQTFVSILPSDTDESLSYQTTFDEDGAFFLALEPGDYTLVAVVWANFMGNEFHTNYIRGKFSVSDSGGDLYIGTLETRLERDGYRVEIRDNFERLSQLYDARFPQRRGTSVNRVIERSQPIGNFDSIAYECAPDWGVECAKKRQGVTPISPEVRKAPGFWPEADSLTPTFSWTPSTEADVTYDLVIYRALRTNFQLGPRYIRGRLITYVEDIPEPSWQPETPLEPDARYYWSVRLRRGSAVSGWTTQGYLFFAVVVSASGSGNWFQFKTPE